MINENKKDEEGKMDGSQNDKTEEIKVEEQKKVYPKKKGVYE